MFLSDLKLKVKQSIKTCATYSTMLQHTMEGEGEITGITCHQLPSLFLLHLNNSQVIFKAGQWPWANENQYCKMC